MKKSACMWLGLSLALVSAGAVAQTVTGSGTVNTVPLFNGASTVTNSAITQSTGGFIGIGLGSTSPGVPLTVWGPAWTWSLSNNSAAPVWVGKTGAAGGISFARSSDGGPQGYIGYQGSGDSANFSISSGGGAGNLNFYSNTTHSFFISGTQKMIIASTGNVGIGTTNPQGKLEINGTLRFTADGSVQSTAWTGVLCGADYAEAVDVAGSKKAYEPGDVLVITDGTDGDVRKSVEAYATTVAGIYATKPGVIGHRDALPKDGEEVPMAMVGIVPTKVTSENGPIHRGDLLVSSTKAGYAMKGTDRNRMLGAVIGKAMGSLDSGTGVIEVLVTLQ